MNLRAFLPVIAAVLLATYPAIADEPRLPGHSLTTKEATAQADNIFVGQLVSLDPVRKASKGEYLGKVIYVTRPANGVTPARVTQNTTVLTPAIPSDLSIPVTMTVRAGEDTPRVGFSYLFYARDNKRPGGSGYEAVKLSPTQDHGLPSRIF